MPLHEPELLSIARLFRARTGVDLTGALGDHGRSGIRRAMARTGEADVRAFRMRLASDVDALDALIDELAVGETFFFRQVEHYEIVRELVVPHVRERREAGGHGLRAWSAGCASGEEIYSLAAMLADLGELEASHLLATDLSREALARAREARYRDWSLRGPAASRMQPWLTRVGGRNVLDAVLRDSVRFFRSNLATDRYPEPLLGLADIDVIFCRNVLIYFEPRAVARVAESLRDTLAPGGWLLLGASDPPLPATSGLEPSVIGGVVVYRRASGARATRREEDPGSSAAATSAGSRPSDPSASGAAARTTRSLRVAPSTIDEARALADSDPRRALEVCERELRKNPLSAELHYLSGVLRLALGDGELAETELLRAVSLDPTLAVVHFVLGTILRIRGDLAGARRAFRNAQREAERMPPDDPATLADGETAATLARAASRHLRDLGDEENGTR